MESSLACWKSNESTLAEEEEEGARGAFDRRRFLVGDGWSGKRRNALDGGDVEGVSRAALVIMMLEDEKNGAHVTAPLFRF